MDAVIAGPSANPMSARHHGGLVNSSRTINCGRSYERKIDDMLTLQGRSRTKRCW